MNEHVDYRAKKANGLTKFFWWCAGADAEILKYSSYSDHVKYGGIGAVVLATGVMAFISMSFAINSLFDSKIGVYLIGTAWGLIIFNLDRFIVSSTGKGDGEDSIGGQEFLNALPRIIMAILLGLVISAPLETKIFEKEILGKWQEYKFKSSIDNGNKIDQFYRIKTLLIDSTITETEERLLRQEEKVRVARERATEERHRGGPGEQWRRDTATQNLEEKELLKLRDKLENYQLERDQFDKDKEAEKKLVQDSIMQEKAGFLDKLMMLEILSSHAKNIDVVDTSTGEPTGEVEEIYGAAGWPIWLIRILFMLIEIAPVLLKLMLVKSPYDFMSENVSQILETKQGISIEHLTDEHSKLHKLKKNVNPRRIINIIEHQNNAEESNAKHLIDEFAAQEKIEISKDPKAFDSSKE